MNQNRLANLYECISCTLAPAQFHKRRAQVLQPLKRLVTAQATLEDGCAFEFRSGCSDEARSLWSVIELERECCAFLRFQVTTEPNGGPCRLEMSGPEGTRAFIESEMELAL